MTTTYPSINREEIARYRLLVREHPDSPTHLKNAVDYFVSVGLPREACMPLQRLLELQPEDSSLHSLRGSLFADMGDWAQAERSFIAAGRLAPDSIMCHHNLGVLYYVTGQVAKAELQFTAVLEIEPGNPEALNDLAVLYAATDREEQALALFEQCLTSAPEYRKGWDNALHFAFSTGRFDLGSGWVDVLFEANPGDAELVSWQQRFSNARRERSADSKDNRGQRRGRKTEEELAAPPETGKISVIIPAHNAERFLAATIASVFAQTYAFVEILVVDDGSLDRTAEIAATFGNRVVYIGQVHQGWASAANEGLQQSRGQWVLIVNPGDVLYPTVLEKFVAFAQANPTLDAVYYTADEVSAIHSEEKLAGTADVTLPFFRREAFARCGFFREAAGDDQGAWARQLLTASLRRSCTVGTTEVPVDIRRSEQINVPANPAYQENVRCRWLATLESPAQTPDSQQAPDIRTDRKTSLKCLIIGADDPGGMLSSYAWALNTYTTHRCRVLVHKTRMPVDPQLVLVAPNAQEKTGEMGEHLRALAKDADRLIFTAGIGAGAVRRDGRLEDTEEVPFGPLDWRTYTGQKKCMVFLCSSPAVRGNYQWYHERFAARGWPVFTASPDIYLHVPDSHFIPPIINYFAPEYTRPDYSVGPVAITFHERPPYAGGGHSIFVPLIAQLKKKHGDHVLFGRCVEMSQRDTLAFRRRIHIGFDRLSFGAPRFGLTSLENSALGLINIVYLDQFSRALLAQTLGTEQLPWLSPDSSHTLYKMLDELVSDHRELQRRMMETAEWFRRFWVPEKLVRRLAAILES